MRSSIAGIAFCRDVSEHLCRDPHLPKCCLSSGSEPFLVSQSQVPFQDSHATHYIESLLSKLVLMSAITDITVLLRICENVLTIDMPMDSTFLPFDHHACQIEISSKICAQREVQ